jgi:hypothetical protein
VIRLTIDDHLSTGSKGAGITKKVETIVFSTGSKGAGVTKEVKAIILNPFSASFLQLTLITSMFNVHHSSDDEDTKGVYKIHTLSPII